MKMSQIDSSNLTVLNGCNSAKELGRCLGRAVGLIHSDDAMTDGSWGALTMLGSRPITGRAS